MMLCKTALHRLTKDDAAPRAARPAGPARLLHAFRCGEDGSILIFSMFIFIMMLMVSGMAVDLMRFETERVRVQSTADRASLAAASLRQERDPTLVVEDYFAKAGLSDRLTGVTVDDNLNFRYVRAETETNVEPFFMQLLGIENIMSDGSGAAEERITNVEIAMVLDISGSMADGGRIANLKDAADGFLTRMLEEDEDDRVSISLVPYNGQVLLSESLFSRFNVTHRHATSAMRCIDPPGAVYGMIGLPRDLAMPQTGNVDSFTGVTNSMAGSTLPNDTYYQVLDPVANNRWCNPRAANEVRVHSNDLVGLRNVISNLEAIGATSVDAGLKWGETLLDPGSRDLIGELVGEGVVAGHFDGRPFEYDDPEVLKVIVLMTDGDHFAQEALNNPYRSGWSPIFRNNDGRYSIHHESKGGKFYVPHLDTWLNRPYGSTDLLTNCSFKELGLYQCGLPLAYGTAKQLTWPQVWEQLRVSWVAHQLYARALGATWEERGSIYFNRYNMFRNLTPTDDMDARTLALCESIKERGVVIFGVAFEAPTGGRDLIRNCASPNRYHEVAGQELQVAFRQISSQITALRLVQ